MELSRTHFRVMIFYDFKRGLEFTDSHENLVKAFGDDAPSLRTVRRWFAEFKHGRQSFEDEPRSGRPREAVTPENVQRVRALIKEQRNVTSLEIQNILDIGSAAVDSILHDHLGVRKVVSRWIPHLLSDDQKQARVDWCQFMLKKFDQGRSKAISEIVTGDETWIYAYDPETKQQSTVWVYEDEPPPTKVVRQKSAAEQMVAVFFRSAGPIAAVPLQERRTVNSEWYCEVCPPTVFEEVCKQRPKTGLRGIFLHHDNARPHTAIRTIDFLNDTRVQLLPHPPYSPDLAPCDFWLFPFLKKHLRGERYPNEKEAILAINHVLKEAPQELFVNCIDDWFRRMSKCIQHHGCYFEKM